MNALLLWVLGILGVLVLVWGLARLKRGGLGWVAFGALMGVFGLGGVWLYQQHGATVFWGLGILGVLLLVWALLNLRRSRTAGWSAALAVLLGLTGFGSITLLASPTQNLLTPGAIPDTAVVAPAEPMKPPPSPVAPEAGLPQAVPEPAPPAPTAPDAAPLPPTTPALPVATGIVREVEPACPCLLNVMVRASNPTIRILQETTEIARSSLERSSFLLEAGDYTLLVEAPGYRSFSALISVPRNRNLEVELAR
jgi:hypothetical protein